jgi:DNA-binding response OmpR family regulator
LHRTRDSLPVYDEDMATNGTLLCIHRDPGQLSLLRDHGYDLVTATNGHEGLRLFMTQSVDAIVLDYHLGLLDGAVVAAEIKQVRPTIPIVLLADHMELPDGALKSVDALVAKSDGPHFLLAAVHFVLHVKPKQRREEEIRSQTPSPFFRNGRSGKTRQRAHGKTLQPAPTETDASPSPWVSRDIRSGKIQL